MPGHAKMCEDMPGYARICEDMPGYTRMCWDVPGYTRIHQDTPGYTCPTAALLLPYCCPTAALLLLGTPWNSLELLGTPWDSKERPRETLPRSTRFLQTSKVLFGGLDCVPGRFEHVFEKFDPRRPRPRGRSLLVEQNCGDGWRKTRKHARARKTNFAFKRV